MIAYNCRICDEQMESPSSGVGQIEMCQNCGKGNLVPFSDSVLQVMGQIIARYDDPFPEIYRVFLLSSSIFHYKITKPEYFSDGNTNPLQEACQPRLQGGAGTLFEVRAYFLRRLGAIMTHYDQKGSTKTELLWFIGDMITAEFKLVFHRTNLGEVIADRYDAYVDAVVDSSGEEPADAILAMHNVLRNHLRFSSAHEPVRRAGTPIVITDASSNYGLSLALIAVENTSMKSFAGALAHLFQKCKDIKTLSPQECQAKLERGLLELREES